MREILILISVGLCAGAFSGTLGIGGGLIMVPALVYLLHFSQHEAQATTLAIMLPPITFMSCYVYYKKGFLDIRVALIVCIGFFVGNYFGGLLATRLSAPVLKKVFALFLMSAAINMFFSKK